MTLQRVVSPEALDQLAPTDLAAQRSRRDLARIHRVMATRSIVARGWRALLTADPGAAPLQVLELGAGDGTLLLGVAQSLAAHWPRVQLTLLDREPVVSAATLAAYAGLGWDVSVHRVDVLDWAARPPGRRRSEPPPRWDLVSTSLFLHHFDGAQLDAVLAAVATRAHRFFACEPRRGWLALAGSHLVGALGANAVTRADAVLSVHAGFRGEELSTRWPDADHWRCQDRAGGLFSHCFSARRGIAP